MWLAFIFLLLFSVFLFLVFIAFADMLKYFVICFNDFLYPSSPLSFLLLFVLFPSFSPNTYCTYKGKESSKCSMIFSISLFIPFSLRAHSFTVFFLFDHFSFIFIHFSILRKQHKDREQSKSDRNGRQSALSEGKENVILENLPNSGYKIENKPAKENGQLE